MSVVAKRGMVDTLTVIIFSQVNPWKIKIDFHGTEFKEVPSKPLAQLQIKLALRLLRTQIPLFLQGLGSHDDTTPYPGTVFGLELEQYPM